MKFYAVGIGMVLGTVAWAKGAACDCPARLSPLEELKASTAVMEVYVVSVGDTDGDTTPYKVSVNKVWKGEPTKNATINVRGANTSCDVTLDVGKNYLVYAKGENLETQACSRTFDAISFAARTDYQEDLAAFKKAKK